MVRMHGPLRGYLFFVEDDKNWNFFDALATGFVKFGELDLQDQIRGKHATV